MEGIYSIVNIINGKMYIGSSNNIERRWSEHRKLLKSNKHPNRKLQYAYNKYGEEQFNYTVIIECEDLIDRERYYIEEFNTMKSGYNLRDPGNVSRAACTEETKKKLSERLKAYYRIVPHHAKGVKFSESRKASIKGRGGKPVLVKRLGDGSIVGTYMSVTQAAAELGLNKKRVQEVASGKKYGTTWKKNSYKGYIFEYIK